MVDSFIEPGRLEPEVKRDIEQQDNIFDPKSVATTIVSDRDNKFVNSFISSVRKSSLDGPRSHKMQEIREDRTVFDLLQSNLPHHSANEDFFSSDLVPPLFMKGTIYFQIMRIYDEEGLIIPQVMPKKTGVSDLDNSIVAAVRDHVYSKGQFSHAYEDIFDGFKTEGTVVMQYGYDGDHISYEKVDLGDMFFDPKGVRMGSGPSDRTGRTIKWAVRQVVFTYADFIEMFPSFAGKVTVGSPQDEPINQTGHGTVSDNAHDDEGIVNHTTNLINSSDRIVVHYAYNIGSLGPVYAVYAGASATLIDLKQGKAYPYKDKKGKPFIPFEIFHFTRSPRNGIYGPSMIGLVKDAAEALKQMMNRAVPNIARSVNPYIFLFGTSDQRIREEMKIYTQQQDQGEQPIIMAGDDSVKIETIGPQSVFPEFQGFRQIVLDDLGARIGFNFRSQGDIDQTATEFLGKRREQIRAVGALNGVNKMPFENVSERTVDLVRLFWKSTDQEMIGFSLSDEADGESFRLPFAQLLQIVKEWDGEWEADTSIEVPQTTQEKALAIDEISIQLANIINGLGFSTMEQVKPSLDLMHEKIVIRNLDDIVSRSELNAMVESLIIQRSQLTGPTENIPQQTLGLEEESVRGEVAPQSLLA